MKHNELEVTIVTFDTSGVLTSQFCYNNFMKAETIKAIFTNVLFVIGIILIIFGFIRGSLTLTRLITFEQYPLNSYEETRCEFEYYGAPSVPVEGETPGPTAEEIRDRKAKCESSLEQERRVRKTEDLVVSFTTLIAGAVLVWSFKKFIFR